MLLIDKLHSVVGELTNGGEFGCVRKETGTKGIYFEAYYQALMK